MMPRQSTLLWTGLAGLFLFLCGTALQQLGPTNTVHLSLGSMDSEAFESGRKGQSVFMRLDSQRITALTSDYELQVRKAAGEFNQQLHPGIPRSSVLVDAFSLKPMQIRRIGATPFRFRLKEFYPDFYFQYAYPGSADTIVPKAPGITLALKTPVGEEIVTLRADQPAMQKLADVVQLGYALEFFWTFPGEASVPRDTTAPARTIIFSGADKTMYFRTNERDSSVRFELNRFYAIPGQDTVGFTVLQCFPDIAYLSARPASKSDAIINPVAEVEMWKLGGRSQAVYLYPVTSGKTGGQWAVPGSDLMVALALSHEKNARNCQCHISLIDASRQINRQVIVKGHQPISFSGRRVSLLECDPNGFWATVRVQGSIGQWLFMAGLTIIIATLLGYLYNRVMGKKQVNFNQLSHDKNQLQL